MLTIDEIKNVSFRKASFSGGYNAEDVDEFRKYANKLGPARKYGYKILDIIDKYSK